MILINVTKRWIIKRKILRGKAERTTQRITSKTLAGPQSAKQTHMILINETKKLITKCKMSRGKAERIT